MEAYGKSIGRRYHEDVDVYIPDSFLNDAFGKIVNSKAYRRMNYKTQVISMPSNPHIRNRMSHTMEVVSFSAMISEQLGLNTNLCMAIALAHDIGHTPYGHVGEEALSTDEKPFDHNVFGTVVAQYFEKCGHGFEKPCGLNLTHEVLEGIVKHSKGNDLLVPDNEIIQEQMVVRYADDIAYTFADLNDALRYGYLKTEPQVAMSLGNSSRERTYRVIGALISESRTRDYISFSEGVIFNQFCELKEIIDRDVYEKASWQSQIETLGRLLEFFAGEGDFAYVADDSFSKLNPKIAVALLTDIEAKEFGEIDRGSGPPTVDKINHFGVMEILKGLKIDGGPDYSNLDYTNPDLDWKEEAIPDTY